MSFIECIPGLNILLFQWLHGIIKIIYFSDCKYSAEYSTPEAITDNVTRWVLKKLRQTL